MSLKWSYLSGEFAHRRWWSRGSCGAIYMCLVSNAIITEPESEIRSCDGEHEEGRTNEDVARFEFSKCDVDYIPRGLTALFTNLTQLDIYNCGLKEILRSDLRGLWTLTTFYARRNLLTSLPDDLFVDMKLRRISFAYNKLKYMSSELLKPLLIFKPIFIDFQGNTNIDRRFHFLADGEAGCISNLMLTMDIQCSKLRNYRNATTMMQIKGYDEYEGPWRTGNYADFTIICGTRVFKVHKFVLTAQCKVLEWTLRNYRDEEQAGIMTINDFSEEAVAQFLEFLYIRRVSEVTDPIELLSIAAKYQVYELISYCEPFVLQDLNIYNAHEVFSLGRICDVEALQKASFAIIKQTVPFNLLTDHVLNNVEALQEIMTTFRVRKRKPEDDAEEVDECNNKLQKHQ